MREKRNLYRLLVRKPKGWFLEIGWERGLIGLVWHRIRKSGELKMLGGSQMAAHLMATQLVLRSIKRQTVTTHPHVALLPIFAIPVLLS
jgi:hypothetical protein